MPVVGLAHPYPRANADELSRHRLSPRQGDRGACQEVCATVLRRDAECLAEVPWTTGKARALNPLSSPLARQPLPLDDLARPKEDTRGDAVRPCGDIGAPVETVGAVDVEVPRRTEHHGVAFSAPPVGVRGRIGLPLVRLHLCDARHNCTLVGLRTK